MPRVKRNDKRERLIQAADKLIYEQTFHTTTLADIAKLADVPLGNVYYYFKTKEDLVFEFYQELQSESLEQCHEICQRIPDFEGRVLALMTAKFEQFSSSRKFFTVLFQSAGDPAHPLSPFSEQTRAIREEAISLFAMCLEGAPVKVADEFRPFLPRLFWFYQMGLILFWIHDASANQKNTKFLHSWK